MLLYSISLLGFSAAFVQAVDYSIPTTWRKPDNTRTRNERNTIAQDAIQNIKTYWDNSSYEFTGLGYWPSANVYSSLAYKDIVQGTPNNKYYVETGLDNIWAKYRNFYKYEYNDDALWWGTASLYAYRAYKDAKFLNYAVANWNEVSKYAITTAQANSNSHPTRNYAIKGTCDGKSTYGGVFWTTKSGDPSANVITTSLYLTLSAYLAEATGDQKYVQAAQNAHQFIRDHLYDTTRFIALDTLNMKDCSKNNWVFTYNSGKYAEGLVTLADFTGNAYYRELALNITGGVTHLSHWQGSDGIITEGQDSPDTNDDGRGFKGIYIRALTEVYRRNPSNAPLRSLVQKYINVQFNALYDLARSGAAYGVVWKGPFIGPYPWGQLPALDVLNGALQVGSQ